MGDVQVPAGAIMLHQILNSRQFNGAGSKVFRQFVDEVVKPSGGNLYLAVRRENAVARGFYERHGMIEVGTVAWAGGTIPGLVYRLSAKVSDPRCSNLICVQTKFPTQQLLLPTRFHFGDIFRTSR